MAPRFHTLTLAGVEADIADAVVLTFAIPYDLREAYAFTPGQYLTLRDTIDGQDVRRSYSICSKLGDDGLSVGVKRIEGGLFSAHAMRYEPGDQLQVMTPEGRFKAPIGGDHDYLLLAAGSGITPMLSIAASVLEGEPESTVTLCYANRTTDTVMFKAELEDLKDRFMTRFILTHVMDEELQDVELLNGRLDGEKLNTMATAGLIHPELYSGIYICGPQPMIEAAADAMAGMGVDKDKIRFELFTPPGGNPISSAQASKPAAEIGADVNITLDGSTRRFKLAKGESLVKAAETSGVEIPYSCNNGMCATCRCKLVAGEADMAQNFSLEDWELEAGFVLACQLRPQSEAVHLDFDAM